MLRPKNFASYWRFKFNWAPCVFICNLPSCISMVNAPGCLMFVKGMSFYQGGDIVLVIQGFII